jgi:hypothetical protein
MVNQLQPQNGNGESPKQSPFTPEVLELIAAHTDAEVSRLTGISSRHVATARKKHNIKRMGFRSAADSELLASLGKMPDTEIASKFNRTLKWVRKARAKLGIERYSPEQIGAQLEKNSEVIELLGKEPDRRLAARFGGSPSLYRQMRNRRNIPVYDNERLDAEAERWERNRAEAMALLGKVPDIELSRRFGGFQCRYTYLRNKAGIPPYDPKAVSQSSPLATEAG